MPAICLSLEPITSNNGYGKRKLVSALEYYSFVSYTQECGIPRTSPMQASQGTWNVLM